MHDAAALPTTGQAVLGRIDEVVGELMQLSRTPGAAMAVIRSGEVVCERAWGMRDLEAGLPMQVDTAYPIASTTKAMNSTLIGMLVDEGLLDWDAPVRRWAPRLRIGDAVAADQLSLRDLLAMRTGLPRHDWLWTGRHVSRGAIAAALGELPTSAAFRDRFQYNNLTATTAGHIAELVTGRDWMDLVRERIFEPLGMNLTTPGLPARTEVCASYHETRERRLVRSQWLASECTAPSGGSVLSTVGDMARWMGFNLAQGIEGGRRLIEASTLAKIQSPQIGCGSDLSAPSPRAAYGMGWFIDSYNGHARIGHGGYLHDVSSEVSLWPHLELGIVSFVNFGCPLPARHLNQAVFDLLTGTVPTDTAKARLAQYEARIQAQAERLAPEGEGRAPGRPSGEYRGRYVHPAYGLFEVVEDGGGLALLRDGLSVPIEPWRGDVWVPASSDRWAIHAPSSFDRSSRAAFETDDDGDVCALKLNLEPAVAPIRFAR